MKTSYLCVPKFKLTTTTSTSYGRSNRRLSPMSLLDRLRQAVYRIIMLNALCKTNVQQTDHGSGGGSDQVQARGGRCGYNYLYDPRHNEAVADCIEFIKKTGITAEENRDSSASGGSIDAASELVFTVPVM
ncbi:hypothetical protein C3L33_17778, partial [Rhododendron williamsianum]